ncbi:cyclic amp receptor-like protein a [Plakobranchus ocellatus]|uniref:Cyclic amp receptor-like protein a n=1 Tax=Plakobranchus ocellatus TaxID=259542 RepID=A0AAV4C207_9GAST|nr:cyclic amp receptor-like protein a [Plakobranchus ocellatus]
MPDWMVLLCVSCLTFNLFMNVIKQTVTEKYEWLYIGICVGIPLIISLLPFSTDRYGPAGAWCWIVDDIGWRMGIWYGPLFFIIVFMMVTYGYIIYVLSRKVGIYLVLQNALSPNHRVFALVLLASISAPLHGALNAIVFGLDKDTLKKLRPSEIKLALFSRNSRQMVREYPQYATFGSAMGGLLSESEEEPE